MIVVLIWSVLVTAMLFSYRHEYFDMVMFTRSLAKEVRTRHVLLALLSFSLALVFSTLFIVFIPYMDIGWLTLVARALPSETDVESSATVSLAVKSMILFFLALFAAVIPAFAAREETSFRFPYIGSSISTQAKQSLIFGLLHLTMGVPLGVALALSFSGGVFMWSAQRKYNQLQNIDIDIDKEHDGWVTACKTFAVQDSTIVHSIHNFLAVMLIAAIIV